MSGAAGAARSSRSTWSVGDPGTGPSGLARRPARGLARWTFAGLAPFAGVGAPAAGAVAVAVGPVSHDPPRPCVASAARHGCPRP
jgi:hypothetical protein